MAHSSLGKGKRGRGLSSRRSDIYETPWLRREFGGTPVWMVITLVTVILAVFVFAALHGPR